VIQLVEEGPGEEVLPSTRMVSPWGVFPSMTTRAGRATTSLTPGMERHPSGPRSTSSPTSTTRGFTRATRPRGPASRRTSTTMTRREIPIWGAARPAPSSAAMVSNMSSTRDWSASSKTSTSFASFRRTGSPSSRISRTAMVVSPFPTPGAPARPASAPPWSAR
jgi:hypothetical protein